MYGSSPTMTPSSDQIAQSSWVKILEVDEPDGSAIYSPYELEDFLPSVEDPTVTDDGDTPLSLALNKGGRVFLAHRVSGLFQILPLFSYPGATATIQVFGFDAVNKTAISGDKRSQGVFPIPGWPFALSISYNLARDKDAYPQTLEVLASDEQQRVAFSTSGTPRAYFARDADTYQIGPRYKFETGGLWAFFVWVTAISQGTLTILGRAS